MKTVALSAGHSFSDPGAVYDAGTRENVITMALVKKTAEILRKHSIGVLTVPDDIGLRDTIKWINDRTDLNGIDLCIELHCNAVSDPSANGVEAWYYHNSEPSKKLSQMVIDGIHAETGMRNRGVKDEYTNRHGRLGFVHDTKPLASLIECGFITNASDRAILMSENGRFDVGKGIARGLLTYLGEKWRPELLETSRPPKNNTAIEDLKNEIALLKRTIEGLQRENERILAESNRACELKIEAYKNKILEIIRKA